MKKFVLYSFFAIGVISHSVQAAQHNNVSTASSTQTTTVSIVKTETVEFIGQDEIQLQQKNTQSSPASGIASICVNSSSNNTTISLSTLNNKQFILTEEHGGNTLPYRAELNTASISKPDNCPHGQQFELSLSIPEAIYNSALPGNYTDTITITIAAE